MAPPMTYEMARALFGLPDPAAGNPAAADQVSQWPTGGDAIDQMVASQGPWIADIEHTHLLMQRAGAALLDKIGPAILLTHSMGGPMGWLMADARPDLVKAIVAVEPLAPAFGELAPGLGQLKWGLTAAPMTLKPAAAELSDLQLISHPADASHPLPMRLQAVPARKWERLGKTPTLIVTAEASFMTSLSQGTVAFLEQVGVPVSHLQLAEHGQHGNGHLMMLEQNSDAVASLISSWLEQDMHTLVR
jgi:pimeloyl-ACP methyl ester carboxylesterase